MAAPQPKGKGILLGCVVVAAAFLGVLVFLFVKAKRMADWMGCAANANVVASNGAMKGAIAQDKDAIGYAGIGHVDQTVKAVVLDGVVPSQENAMNGSYPVVRKLYMNTKGEPSMLVKTFIDYIMSSDGAAIIAKSGYLPLK